MKIRLLAAGAAAMFFALQAIAVSADYGYDNYDYGYNDYYNNDYTYDNYSYDNYYYDDGSADNYAYNDSTAEYTTGYYGDSSIDPTQDHPTAVTLEPGKITDMKFSAKLMIKSNVVITAADITITYDPEVFKITSNKVNEEAGGEAVATDMGSGTFQYIYTNDQGSEWEDEYLTIDFEVVDPTAGSSVLYITVNSMLDSSLHEITVTSDGTVVQIEGAVPVDASADESMYSELRVARIDRPISYESLGLKDVKAVTFEDGELATADENGITTLMNGITNMTVEYNDGTFKYYRLVISEQKAEESAADETGGITAEEETTQTTAADNGITKTETNNSGGVKKLIILVIVVLAAAAIVIEYFMIVGNPFAKAAAKRKEKPKSEGLDDDFFPEASKDEDQYDDTDNTDGTGQEESEESVDESEMSDGDFVEEYDEYNEEYAEDTDDEVEYEESEEVGIGGQTEEIKE